MLEEDRLAWQQLATGAQLRQSPDEDHPMLGDIDTIGDDWESLEAEDFPMEEAVPKQNLSTDRQIQQPEQGQLVQQPQIESVNRQTDPPAAQRQLMQHPQFPSDAQMQRSADGRNWQVVPTR